MEIISTDNYTENVATWEAICRVAAALRWLDIHYTFPRQKVFKSRRSSLAALLKGPHADTGAQVGQGQGMEILDCFGRI